MVPKGDKDLWKCLNHPKVPLRNTVLTWLLLDRNPLQIKIKVELALLNFKKNVSFHNIDKHHYALLTVVILSEHHSLISFLLILNSGLDNWTVSSFMSPFICLFIPLYTSKRADKKWSATYQSPQTQPDDCDIRIYKYACQ